MCLISKEGCLIRLLGLNQEDFPNIPPIGTGENILGIEGQKLAKMIDRTIFACAQEKTRTRHTMTGILLIKEVDMVEMVATDGRRLAISRQNIFTSPGMGENIIIPQQAIRQIRRIIGEEETVCLGLAGKTHLTAKAGRTYLCCRLIEGEYPNYKSAIPTDNGITCGINSEVLIKSIRQVIPLITEERYLIKFSLGGNTLLVEAKGEDVGEGTIEIPINYAGETTEIGLNPGFLLDGLGAMGGPVRMEFKDPTSAVTIRDGEDYLYIVMPIRLT